MTKKKKVPNKYDVPADPLLAWRVKEFCVKHKICTRCMCRPTTSSHQECDRCRAVRRKRVRGEYDLAGRVGRPPKKKRKKMTLQERKQRQREYAKKYAKKKLVDKVRKLDKIKHSVEK